MSQNFQYTELTCSCHFGFKTRLDSIKIAKMADVHCCVPFCNNDKRYDSGKDLSYINFSRDKKKGKDTPSLEYTQVHFQIQNGGFVIRVFGSYCVSFFYLRL